MKHSWKNIPHNYSILFTDEEIVNTSLPEEAKAFLLNLAHQSDNSVEICFSYTSSGYYDSGKISGPPESCYPPEGEEELLLDRITIDHNVIEPKIADTLFEYYYDVIYENTCNF